MLELKTHVVFETLKELEEAVELGLRYKDNWLNGMYSFPMLQSKYGHSDHYTISSLWDNLKPFPGLVKCLGEEVNSWSKAREEYIPKQTEELTLAEICAALGRDIKIVK